MIFKNCHFTLQGTVYVLYVLPRVLQIQIPSVIRLMLYGSRQQHRSHLGLVSFIKWAGMHQVLHTAPPALDFTYLIWHFFGLHKYTQLGWLLFLAPTSNLYHLLPRLQQANFSLRQDKESVKLLFFHMLHCSDPWCSGYLLQLLGKA